MVQVCLDLAFCDFHWNDSVGFHCCAADFAVTTRNHITTGQPEAGIVIAPEKYSHGFVVLGL
jgi:hypothetical protein